MSRKAIIIDIDGTLADVTHRLPALQARDWQTCFETCDRDVPYQNMMWFVSLLSVAYSSRILLCTGRPESYRIKTTMWLDRHEIPYDRLYMRRNDDLERPDYEVKRELLDQMRADGYDPLIAIEDRYQCVAMWRAAGLTCLQCADGDY